MTDTKSIALAKLREKMKAEEANDPIKILSTQVKEQQNQIIQLQKQVDALTK